MNALAQQRQRSLLLDKALGSRPFLCILAYPLREAMLENPLALKSRLVFLFKEFGQSGIGQSRDRGQTRQQ